MSIASTRKVSGSPNAPSKADYYHRGGNGESFVENIDTTNNVLVNNNDSDNRGNRQNSPFQKQEEKNNRPEVSSPNTYIPNALEALAASGVYDDVPDEAPNSGSRKIGVYDNNQSIIRDPGSEQLPHSYLKHFYERNEIIEEVDELV